ncbi:pantetheine-phosphate adenylyltransferase [Anaerotaenia torta]|uniref:pantetheine-phosphate adenylyltransferase n=1 Tax=Anaerotaenia torta TaxID=433293 RepID=UPI003D24FC4F
MKIGIYPGSFDPITLGHLDIIVRASGLVDKLIVGVLKNNAKRPMFSTEERVEFIERVIGENPKLKSVEVNAFDGLLIDFARERGASIIVRGLRAITDFEYELQIAQMNHKLDPGIDTVFFTTSVEYSYLSSSAVKEIASFGGNINQFVPECIVQSVYDKYKSIRSV